MNIYQLEKPDIILADINMPRMNGLVFAEKVKADNKEVLIAFITGYDYFDYALAALKTGVDDYILKPVSRKDIEGVLKKFTSILEERNRDKNLGLIKTKLKETTMTAISLSIFVTNLFKISSRSIFEFVWNLLFFSKYPFAMAV